MKKTDVKNNEVRIGIIGVGGMGSYHARNNFKNVSNCRLTAFCDIDRAKADALAAELGAKAYYDSNALIKSGEVDMILVATPHYDHTPICIAGLDAGLHVLSEKPIAVHKADAEEMIKAGKRNPKLRFGAMFQLRTIAAHRKLKEVIGSGELGDIRRINWINTDWYRTQSYYDSGGWRATWAGEGGGVLLNQCPHNLDLFQWWFGMPSKVRAFCELGKWHDIEVEDEVTAFLSYPNGATAVFITGTGEYPGTNRLEVACDRGRLLFENGKILFKRTECLVSEDLKTNPAGFSGPPVWDVEIPVGGNSPNLHGNVLQAFVDGILDPKAELVARAEEGIRSVELANAMLYSSLEGRTMDLPLDGSAFKAKLKGMIKKSKFIKKASRTKVGDFTASFK